MTKEELINLFPELANRSDSYIEGFQQAVEGLLAGPMPPEKGQKGGGSDLPPLPFDQPEQPDGPENPENPENPDNPEGPEGQEGTQKPEQTDQPDVPETQGDNPDGSEKQGKNVGHNPDSPDRKSQPGDVQHSTNKSNKPRIGEISDIIQKQAAEAKAQSDDPDLAKEGDDLHKLSNPRGLMQNAKRVKEKEEQARLKQQQDLKAQTDEIDKWQRDPKNQFKQSIKLFFSQEDDERKPDIATPNTRRDFGDEDQVVAGRKKFPSGGKPTINIYFDQANSASQHIMDAGEFVLSSLAPYESKNMCKVNLFYFAQNVHKEDRATLSQASRYTWPDGDDGSNADFSNLISHIRKTGAENVIIITDHKNDSSITMNTLIPGAVWIFFYSGAESLRLTQAIRGRSLNKHWSIN